MFRLVAGVLPLVVTLLLILAEALLQHLLEVLVLLRQILGLPLERIMAAACLGPIPILERRTHRLDGGLQAVASRSGFGDVVGVPLGIALQLVSAQADRIVQN